MKTPGLRPARKAGVVEWLAPVRDRAQRGAWLRWSPRRQGALTTGLDLLVLVGYWLAFFWPVLIRHDRSLQYDIVDQHYPFHAFINRSLHLGEWPAWAPHILGGYPLAADPLAAMFYPPNLLMYALAGGADLPYLLLEWQSALHNLWAAIGTYLLGRTVTGSRPGAVLAGLVYAFGSFFATHGPHLSALNALSWLPWIVLLAWRALVTQRLGWIALGALAYAAMILAGHALTMVQTTYVLVAVFLVHAWRVLRTERRVPWTAAASIATMIAAGSAVAAVQLLPSAELAEQTERAAFTYQDSALSSLAPLHVATLLLPNFFAYEGPARFWATGDLAETVLYVGLLPLFLAALGVARAQDRRAVSLLLFGAVLSLALAFGSGTWLHRLAFDFLPGFDRVRRPVNSLALMQLALALLASYGVTALEGRSAEQSERSFAALAAWLWRALIVGLAFLSLALLGLATTVGGPAQMVLATIVNGTVVLCVFLFAAYLIVRAHLQGLLSMRLCLAALVLLTGLDLATALAGKPFNTRSAPPTSFIGPDHAGDPAQPVVRFLLGEQQRDAPERFRIYPEVGSYVTPWDDGPLVWAIDSARGYSVLWPRYYRELVEAAARDVNSPLFDLLNVRYLLALQPLRDLHGNVDPEKFPLVYDGGPDIYENRSAGPRAWIAHQAVYRPGESALSYLQANASSLRDVVVLAEPPPGPSSPAQAEPGTARITSYRSNRVRIRATLPAPGFVVLADTYYPGWEATVDEQAARVYRADHAFRAVYVPAGEHDVEFAYQFPALQRGLFVSIVALAGVIGLGVFGLAAAWRAWLPGLFAAGLVLALGLALALQAGPAVDRLAAGEGAAEVDRSLYLASRLAQIRSPRLLVERVEVRQLTRVSVGGVLRLAVLQHAPSAVDLPLVVPVGQPRLLAGIGIADTCAPVSDGVGFAVDVLRPGAMEGVRLFERLVDPAHEPNDRSWSDVAIDLSPYAGQPVTLRFLTATGPADDRRCDWAVWSEPRVQPRALP